MKTAYLINSLEGGGAERVFVQLLEMVGEEGDVGEPLDIVLLDIRPEAYRLPVNATVHRVGRSSTPVWPLIQFFKVFVLLARLRPKRVVSFLTRANVFNVICSKFLNFESVISERSNTTGRLSGKFSGLKRGLVGFFYARAARICAVSHGVANCLVHDFSISPSKVSVLNNPVDLDAIEQSSRRPRWQLDLNPCPKIVAMGRLVETKGFGDLIRAYAQSGQNCGLMILGDGPKRYELEELIDSLGLSSHVHLLGFVGNPYALINQAEVFVLSSRLEGFPNALVESMALAKAVISTDCHDGPREILSLDRPIADKEVVQTEFGLMVNVGDNQAMAKAITQLIGDQVLRQQLADNARERVQRYSKQEFYQSYKDLLASVDSANISPACLKSKVL